jgi:hypothetical protein
MKALVLNRSVTSAALSVATGLAALRMLPFPEENGLIQLVWFNRPALFYAAKYAYMVMLFSTPYVVCSVVLSLAYIFVVKHGRSSGLSELPPYPEASDREKLFLVIGELHHAKRPEPAEHPYWLTIPGRGLFTGIAIFGAIGSGKTSGCMYPFAEQLLGYRPGDHDKRIGGLFLEVKGDFCYKLRRILEQHRRGSDYVELSLESDYRYNPLHNDLDAYALAYGIASVLNNLFGKGKEPFWQQAYTNLVKFVILLHKVLYDYVTLFDVYEGAINPELLEQRIQEGERMFQSEYLLITLDAFLAEAQLEKYPFERDSQAEYMKAPFTEELKKYLDASRIPYEIESESGASAQLSGDKREQFEAVKRWFYHDWKRIEPRLRTSIVEGISVFLSLFDADPAVKRVFCPPKETYDPVLNKDGRYGKPLAPFSQLIESGAVCALNLPLSANPGLTRVIGTLLKQDFQRAVIGRIPRMEQEPQRQFREVVFLCDEYQSFATVGESDPSGDEKFFALSRQAKCIPVVATQSISSLRSTLSGEAWRTLLQTFRTKIFLSLSDDFSARTASELCGKEEQLKLNYSFSEHGQDAGVSVLTGLAAAHRATVGASKGYSVARDFVFEPKIFAELKNMQAIVLAYDGLNPWPPSYCYLKPYFLDKNTSYFEQLAKGELA